MHYTSLPSWDIPTPVHHTAPIRPLCTHISSREAADTQRQNTSGPVPVHLRALVPEHDGIAALQHHEGAVEGLLAEALGLDHLAP